MILPPGTHCSRLSRNGSHMSTHTASIPFRWRLVNSVRKYSSSVSFLRSFPNHNGSAVSRLHTTVRNLSRFPWYSSSTPMCRNGGFRRLASQRSKYRRSMPRTVLCARPIRRATCRAAALSQDCPTVLKPFAVGRLAGQLRHLLRLHSARRAIHPIQFHHHRGLILKARQIPDLSFIHLVHLVHPSSAARTGHAAIPPLAPDPQLELLVLFVDLLLIDPIARESQHLRPVVLHDQPSLVATLLPPLWFGKERKKETLDEYFRTELTSRQRKGIEAVCVDMWEPFRLSLEQWVPGGKIIYDKFHVLGHANDAVDEVRKAEFFRQGREKRELIKRL